MGLDNKLFWYDAGGCHWCGRNTDSIKDGHDGMCPVPLLAIYDEQVAQLEERVRELEEELEQLRVEGARADDCVYEPSALRGE